MGGCWCNGYFGAYPPIGHSFCSYCGCFACYGNGGFGNGAYGNGWHGCCWCAGCYCGCLSPIGCYCGYSCWGPLPAQVQPVPPANKDKKDSKDGKGQEEDIRLQNRARLIVQVPSDAKLYIDGKLMTSTAERRVFATPELQRGQVYFYDVTAEVVRDGQTISDTRRVYLRAGQVAETSFGEMIPATATARSED